MAGNTLVIRADASVATGLGHMMRCLAIAQAWQDAGGDVVYVMAESTDAVARRLRAEGMTLVHLEVVPGSIQDAGSLVETAYSVRASWVVLDGYHFGEEYQRYLRASDLRVLAIDDRNTWVHSYADIILNPDDRNFSEEKRQGPGPELLLSPKYALLRREFLSRNRSRKLNSEGRLKLLVTMGGSDPENLSLKVMEALNGSGLRDCEIVVLVGGSNPHFVSLGEIAGKMDRGVRLVKDPSNIARWMAWADVAVTVAGNSVWELLFMGCAVLCYSRNEHDRRLTAWLEAQGAIVDLGPSISSQNERLHRALERVSECTFRNAMKKNARSIVDGQGAKRIVEKLRSQVPAQTQTRASL